MDKPKVVRLPDGWGLEWLMDLSKPMPRKCGDSWFVTEDEWTAARETGEKHE
jgi:hypothetical protein